VEKAVEDMTLEELEEMEDEEDERILQQYRSILLMYCGDHSVRGCGRTRGLPICRVCHSW